MNFYIRVIVLLLATAQTVNTLGQELKMLDAYCVSAVMSMSNGIGPDRALLAIQLNTTARTQAAADQTSAEYWYGEWQQQLVPLPPGGAMRSDEHHGFGSFLSLQGEVSLSLGYSALHILRKTQNDYLKILRLPSLSRSSFDLLRLGLSTRIDEFECDSSNPQSMVNAIAALKMHAHTQVLRQ